MIKNLLPTVWRKSETPVRGSDDHPFFALHREMNRMFDDFFHSFDLTPFGGGRSFATFSPSVDIREDEKEVSIKAELPGLDEKDIEVTLAADSLTIRGEKKEEKEEKGKEYWHREMSYGSFHRVIPLPEGLNPNPEKAEARFKKGVLTVTLPRLEEASTKGKRIAVKAE